MRLSARPRAALIVNPAAGQGSDVARIAAWLEPHLDLAVLATSTSTGADACTRRALEGAPELVIAAGGDGTVSKVAGVLVGTSVPLGILPRGTSNSLAAGLGVPTDDDGALATILARRPVAIDTAVANGRPMLLHASTGAHAATVGGTPRGSKSRWGVLAYVMEALAQLTELEPFDVAIETEREIVRCRAVNVTVANVAPPKTLVAQGPAVVSPTDGALDVTIVAAASLAEAVASGLHLLRTSLEGVPAARDDIGFLSAARVRITSVPEQPLLVDGEPAGRGALEVRSRPKSLLVLLPSDHALPRRDGAAEKLEGLPGLEITTKR